MSQTHNQTNPETGTEAENLPKPLEIVQDLTDELEEAVASPKSSDTSSGQGRRFQRRSSRLSIAIPVIIAGTDADGKAFKENAWTVSVSKHGAKLAVFHRLALNSEVSIENPIHGHTSKGRVVFVEKGSFPEDPYQVGVELVGQTTVWGIRFPPEDWKPDSRVARPTGRDQSRQPQSVLVGSKIPLTERAPSASVPERGETARTGSIEVQKPQVASGGEVAESLPDPKVASVTAVDNLPKTDPNFQRIRAIESRLTATQRGLGAISDVVARAHGELRAEIDTMKRQAEGLIAQRLESKLKLFEGRLDSIESLLGKDPRDRVAQGLSEAVEPILTQQKSLFEGLLRDQVSQVRQQLEAQVQETLESRGREFSEKARADLLAIADSARAGCGEVVKGLDGLNEQVGAIAQRAHQELASREAAFRMTVQEALDRARRELQELELAASESIRGKAGEIGEETARSVSESAEQTLKIFIDTSHQRAAAMSDEEMARIRLRLAELSASSQEGLARYLDVLTAQARNESERQLRTALDQTVQEVNKRIELSVEDQVESIGNQARQLASDTLLMVREQAETAGTKITEDLSRGLEGLAKPALESIDLRSKAVEAELERTMKALLGTALDRFREAEAQLTAAGETASVTAAEKVMEVEAEYQRKLERIFAEATHARIRQFEAHLASASQEHFQSILSQVQQEFESARRDFAEKVQQESDRTARNAASSLNQGVGAAAMMLKEWLDQATDRLEGAAHKAAKASQQQITSFVDTSLEELHRGAAVHLRELRARLQRAVAAMGNLDQPSVAAKLPEPSGPNADLEEKPEAEPGELLKEVQEEREVLSDAVIEGAVKAFRARLEEMLKPAEATNNAAQR